MPINVTIWNEFRHEKHNDEVKAVYPDGIHIALKNGLENDSNLNIRTATLDEPEHGLTDDVLNTTDVMLWWGHMAHDDVNDDIVAKVHERVLNGMGIVVLHSGHFSKIFKRLMGTTCNLKWREAAEVERIWTTNPAHPIAQGLPPYFEVPKAEMYGEYFGVPEPDSLVFVSWFEGGEVFRSGLCYEREQGKIFYFRPGHETFPIFYQPEILQVISNAIYWAKPTNNPQIDYGNVPDFIHQAGE